TPSEESCPSKTGISTSSKVRTGSVKIYFRCCGNGLELVRNVAVMSIFRFLAGEPWSQLALALPFMGLEASKILSSKLKATFKRFGFMDATRKVFENSRSEEHTSELQSRENIVC